MGKRQVSEAHRGFAAAEKARRQHKKEGHKARYKRRDEKERGARFATVDVLRETIRQAYLRKLGR
jgi:hypothetical protein